MSDQSADDGLTSSARLAPLIVAEQVIAVLVHGTCARGAAWCQSGSHFCTKLQASFEKPIKFHTFSWSGWNLHRARILAGERLAAHVIRVANDSPNATIILIGHSHGGNVIRYSLNSAEAAKHVNCAVTLATPFVNVDPRPYSGWLAIATKAFAIEAIIISFLLVFGATIYSIVELFEPRQAQKIMKFLSNPFAVTFFFAPCTLLIFGALRRMYVNRIGRVMSSIEQKLFTRQAEMILSIDPPLVENLPLLSVEVQADEARLLLATSHFLSNWTHKTLSNKYLNVFALFLVLPGLLMIWFGWWLEISWSEFIDYLIWYQISLVLTLLVVPFVVFSFLMISIGIPRLLKAPIFGEETIYENWLIDSIQTAKPLGWSPNTHERFIVTSRWYSTLGSLRHSLVYSTSAITERLGEWLNETISREIIEAPTAAARQQLSADEMDFDAVIAAAIPPQWKTK